MELLKHNQKTLNELNYYAARGLNCCVVNPCGSGKTAVMAAFIEENPDKSYVIFTKQKNATDYYRAKNNLFSGKNVKIVTYMKMLRDYRSEDTDAYNADYYLVDEAHYVGADQWSIAFRFLCEKYTPVLIGLTATPQRFQDQGTEETIVNSFFSGHSVGNYTSNDLQQMGVFIEPEYILSIYGLENEINNKIDRISDSDMTEKSKEYYRNRLLHVLSDWERHQCPKIILKKRLPEYIDKNDSNRILVYVSSVDEIDEKEKYLNNIIGSLYPGKTIKSYRYTYRQNEDEFKQFLKNDDTYIKVLYSVDKIMETIHIDDLRVVIMLRPSVSNRIITQQFGRINSIGSKKKALIIDMVDNLSNLNLINFENRGGIGKQAVSGNSKSSVTIPELMSYKSIFSEIDNALSRYPTYEYYGFRGSLGQVCKVANRDISEVREYISQGKDIYEAIDLSRRTSMNISDEVFSGNYKYPDFALTEEQKVIVEKNIRIVTELAARYKIKNDDVIQDLYMDLMYRVSTLPEEMSTNKTYMYNQLKNRYAKLYRDKIARESMYADPEVLYMQPAEDEIEKSIIKHELLYLFKSLDTLTNREKRVMCLRYGLDGKGAKTLEEVAKIFEVTRERIRQIENKALRKLRHPSRMGNKTGRAMLEMFEEV